MVGPLIMHGYMMPYRTTIGARRQWQQFLGPSGARIPFVIEGPMDTEVFRNYVEQIMVPELKPVDIFVLDNLRIITLLKICGSR